jgi:hypothetical protein
MGRGIRESVCLMLGVGLPASAREAPPPHHLPFRSSSPFSSTASYSASPSQMRLFILINTGSVPFFATHTVCLGHSRPPIVGVPPDLSPDLSPHLFLVHHHPSNLRAPPSHCFENLLDQLEKKTLPFDSPCDLWSLRPFPTHFTSSSASASHVT